MCVLKRSAVHSAKSLPGRETLFPGREGVRCVRLINRVTFNNLTWTSYVRVQKLLAKYLTIAYLVSQQHTRYWTAIMKLHLGIQILLPFEHGIKCRGPSHIKDDEGTHSLLVVHPGHVAKPFLTWINIFIRKSSRTKGQKQRTDYVHMGTSDRTEYQLSHTWTTYT